MVRLVLLAAPGPAHDLAVELARDLPDLLAERLGEIDWDVTVEEEPMAAATTRDVDLVDVARRRLLENDWDLVICVTDCRCSSGAGRSSRTPASRTASG